MSTAGQMIRQHHEYLTNELSSHICAISEQPDFAVAHRLSHFLDTKLLQHGSGEEQAFYPVMAPVLHAARRVNDSMCKDHQHVTQYVRRICEAVSVLSATRSTHHAPIEAHLLRLVIQLEAVLRLHFEKEDDIYVSLFERYVPENEQQRVVEAMCHAGAL